MKISNDTIGNRSHDLPVCSAVPQPLRHRVGTVNVVKLYCRQLSILISTTTIIITTTTTLMAVQESKEIE
jgi:hypothetical protein